MITNTKEINGFYIFSDLRGFTNWSESNQTEIDLLLDMVYTLGLSSFGERKGETYPKRIVKFLGDGFFAVNEFKRTDNLDFINKMNETLYSCSVFILNFMRELDKVNIHDKERIGVGFGIAFGSAIRFNLPGGSLDYAGKHVNYSARLCAAAENGEILMEKEFSQYRSKMQIPEMYYYDERHLEMKSIGEYNAISVKPEKIPSSIWK